jgi:hypothetical protein
MNPQDEELQERVEHSGRVAAEDGLDASAYQQIFHSLRQDPGYALPANFAESLANRLMPEQKSFFSRDFAWFGIGIFGLTASFCIAILFFGFKIDFTFLTGLGDFKGLLIFGISFVAFLNWLDKKVVRTTRFQ